MWPNRWQKISGRFRVWPEEVGQGHHHVGQQDGVVWASIAAKFHQKPIINDKVIWIWSFGFWGQKWVCDLEKWVKVVFTIIMVKPNNSTYNTLVLNTLIFFWQDGSIIKTLTDEIITSTQQCSTVLMVTAQVNKVRQNLTLHRTETPHPSENICHINQSINLDFYKWPK